MPKTRKQKEQILKQAKDDVSVAKSMVFAGYHGLSVPEINILRDKLKEEKVKFSVIKKTLLKTALQEKSFDIDVKNLGEGLAVAFAFGDEVAPAKVLAQFQKNHKALSIYGGVLDGKFVDTNLVIALSKIPSREELYAKLVGSINAPIEGFVNSLYGTIRGFVILLSRVVGKKS